MLDFDIDRFLRIETGALALAPAIHDTVGRCLSQGAGNIFFLGTGGAAILMQPAVLLLQRRSGFPVFTDNTAELVTGGHQALGPGSLVVIPSVSGTTKESVAALEYCREKGATVISLVGHAETPLGKGASHSFVNFADDGTAPESLYIQSLLLALSVMAHRGEWRDYPQTLDELSYLPRNLVAAKQQFEPQAARTAEALGGETWHIISSAGNCWAPASYFAMCVLEETQWIRMRPAHAADFFHGTFELVEAGVSVILLKGEDSCRGLTERVERFARSYTDKVTVLDAAAYELPGLSKETRALVSPILLASLLERLTLHLSHTRNHPLDQRRYYRKVPY